MLEGKKTSLYLVNWSNREKQVEMIRQLTTPETGHDGPPHTNTHSQGPLPSNRDDGFCPCVRAHKSRYKAPDITQQLTNKS